MGKWTELPSGVKPAVAKEFFDGLDAFEAKEKGRLGKEWVDRMCRAHGLTSLQVTQLLALHHKYRGEG